MAGVASSTSRPSSTGVIPTAGRCCSSRTTVGSPETSWCAAVGMTVSLWRAEQRQAQAAGVPQAGAILPERPVGPVDTSVGARAARAAPPCAAHPLGCAGSRRRLKTSPWEVTISSDR
jgi:hypothetical protein